jgi:hypothetical protein
MKAPPKQVLIGQQAMASATDEHLWMAKHVADFLNVSLSWVYMHADAGNIPSLRICGCLRFVPADVRAFALASRNAA